MSVMIVHFRTVIIFLSYIWRSISSLFHHVPIEKMCQDFRSFETRNERCRSVCCPYDNVSEITQWYEILIFPVRWYKYQNKKNIQFWSSKMHWYGIAHGNSDNSRWRGRRILSLIRAWFYIKKNSKINMTIDFVIDVIRHRADFLSNSRIFHHSWKVQFAWHMSPENELCTILHSRTFFGNGRIRNRSRWKITFLTDIKTFCFCKYFHFSKKNKKFVFYFSNKYILCKYFSIWRQIFITRYIFKITDHSLLIRLDLFFHTSKQKYTIDFLILMIFFLDQLRYIGRLERTLQINSIA